MPHILFPHQKTSTYNPSDVFPLPHFFGLPAFDLSPSTNYLLYLGHLSPRTVCIISLCEHVSGMQKLAVDTADETALLLECENQVRAPLYCFCCG